MDQTPFKSKKIINYFIFNVHGFTLGIEVSDD